MIQFVTFSSPNVGGHQQPLKKGSLKALHHPKKVTAWSTQHPTSCFSMWSSIVILSTSAGASEPSVLRWFIEAMPLVGYWPCRWLQVVTSFKWLENTFFRSRGWNFTPGKNWKPIYFLAIYRGPFMFLGPVFVENQRFYRMWSKLLISVKQFSWNPNVDFHWELRRIAAPILKFAALVFFNWWELRWLVKKWYIYCQLGDYMGVSKNSGIPKWMVKKMENPIKMDDLGVPLFSENIHMPPTTFYRNQKQPLRIRSIFWGSAHCVNTPRHMKPLKMGWFQECFGLLHSVVPIADGFSGNFLGRCTCG